MATVLFPYAMLAVSGSLNDKMSGPPVPVRPDVHGPIVVGEDKTTGDNRMPVESSLNGEEFRRSVYIQVRRSRPLAMRHAFDAPVMEVNCERRQTSTVATQSLMLMNSQFLLDPAARFAARLRKDAGDDRAKQVDRAWWLAFQRRPSATERADASAFLERQVAHLAALPVPATDDKFPKAVVTIQQPSVTSRPQSWVTVQRPNPVSALANHPWRRFGAAAGRRYWNGVQAEGGEVRAAPPKGAGLRSASAPLRHPYVPHPRPTQPTRSTPTNERDILS